MTQSHSEISLRATLVGVFLHPDPRIASPGSSASLWCSVIILDSLCRDLGRRSPCPRRALTLRDQWCWCSASAGAEGHRSWSLSALNVKELGFSFIFTERKERTDLILALLPGQRRLKTPLPQRSLHTASRRSRGDREEGNSNSLGQQLHNSPQGHRAARKQFQLRGAVDKMWVWAPVNMVPPTHRVIISKLLNFSVSLLFLTCQTRKGDVL